LAWLYVLDDQNLLSQKCSLEELVQTQLDIQVVIMAAYPQEKSLQDNLVKCVSNELGHFEFTKDFIEKIVTQATRKHLLGSGMWALATYKSYNTFANSTKIEISFF
jgi:tRNA isopentenyl-2-thiomethyl-A-37 hydroxylase MiaE